MFSANCVTVFRSPQATATLQTRRTPIPLASTRNFAVLTVHCGFEARAVLCFGSAIIFTVRLRTID